MVPYLGEGDFYEGVEVFGSADYIRLKQAEHRTPFGEVCRKAGVSDDTFFSWRKK